MNRTERSSINMLYSVAGFTIPMLVSFVTTPLLLRGLGEAAYGLQSLVAVIIGYLMVMEMGLDLPIIKFLAEDHAHQDADAENRLLSTTLQLYASIGLVGMVVIVLLADWLARSIFRVPDDLVGQTVTVFRLAGIGFLGSVGMSWGRAVAMGLERFDLHYFISLIVSTAGTIIGLGVVYAGHGVVGYVFVRIVFTLLAGPVYFVLVRHLLSDFRFHWGLYRGTIRRVAGYLGYGLWNRILGNVLGSLDKTLIGVWIGLAATGLYSVPFMIANSLGYMVSYMFSFVFPMASALQSLGELERLRDIFVRASRFIAALAGFVFIPLLVLGDSFLMLWTPTIVAQVASVLRLLMLAGYLSILTTGVVNNVVLGLGRMKQFTIYTTIRWVTLAVFFVLLIRPLGLEGAALALLLTCGVDVVYFVIALRRYLQISPLELFQKAYLKPIALSVVLGALSFLARPLATSWIGLGMVGAGLGLFYVVVGYWVGVFGETEKRAVVGLWQMAVQRANSIGRPR
ncbi:MAG: oligosaccharide flippase family protein [Anaerolineales bacterium]|nr:oligosaccharide flippase family protein [Anaerolineales bacterium]